MLKLPTFQILLDETRAEMNIHLHEWRVSDALEAVDLSSFDDKYVPGASFEFLPVDVPQPAALAYELDFIVWMPVGSRTATWECTEQEH